MDQDLGSPDFRAGNSYSACKSLENYRLLWDFPQLSSWRHSLTPPRLWSWTTWREVLYLWFHYTVTPATTPQGKDGELNVETYPNSYSLHPSCGPCCELGIRYADEPGTIPCSKGSHYGGGDDRNGVSGDHYPLHYSLPCCQRSKGNSVWCSPGCIT